MGKDTNDGIEVYRYEQLNAEQLAQQVPVIFYLSNGRALHPLNDPDYKDKFVLHHHHHDSQNTEAAIALIAHRETFVETAQYILKSLAPTLLS